MKKRQDLRQGYYKTRTWKKIRKRQFAKHALCEHCLKEGTLTVATVCDHIDPTWETWDEFIAGPFQSLCRQCHDFKTYLDMRKKRKAEKVKECIIEV